MGDDPGATLLAARAQACQGSSLRLIDRAQDHAEAQWRYARAVRVRLEQRAAESANRWPVRHGLASARTALGAHDDEHVLGSVLETARALFGGCAAVSLTTVDQLTGGESRSSTAAATGAIDAIDAIQYQLGEGPGIDAVELDMVAVLRAEDFAAANDARHWPRFAPAATALGVRSSLSIAVPWTAFRVGLQAQRRALGAINFYARAPHGFAQTEHHAMMLGCWAAAMFSGHEPAEIYRAGLSGCPPAG